MRVTLHPQAREAFGLLGLPWHESLEHWTDPRLVTPRDEGLHRHVVRFVEGGGRMWAIKELPEPLADREYRVLSRLDELGISCVPVYGVVAERAPGIEAALITGFLDYSSTYRAVFTGPRGPHSRDRLIDALAQLLARLHLAGVYWGDCSLSNTLFRLDAGQIAAYFLDAETAELHTSLSSGQRETDLDLATGNVLGELLDLQAGGLLGDDVDPWAVVAALEEGYRVLWEELTADWLFGAAEAQDRLRERMQRLNDLGFDVDELELLDAGEGQMRLRVTTKISEPGYHRRLLYQRTGLLTEENQARRLLNDIASYRAWLERQEEREIPEVVATNRWLSEIYDPVVEAIPPQLRDKLAPAEVFHEVLEHRWYLSQAARRKVSTPDATAAYVAEILPAVPDDLTSGAGPVEPGRG
jgi:hypothetical protein